MTDSVITLLRRPIQQSEGKRRNRPYLHNPLRHGALAKPPGREGERERESEREGEHS